MRMSSRSRVSSRCALVLILLIGCTQPPAQPPAMQSEASTLPTVTLPDGSVFRVEVAANDELRAQGLMYRDRLREGYGMIFIFPRTDVYPFWMKNTLIPLDMIWIDESRRVVHVKHDVPPCKADPCPSYDPEVPGRYVLEVAGGKARQHGLKVGDVLTFSGVPEVP